jgi:putative phage-type endonuclease
VTGVIEARSSWATPQARLILPADTDRDVWLTARRKGIGGSDAPVLLDASPYQSLYGLWLEKTGQAEDFEGNDATRRGTWLEPHLADWFVEETSIPVRRCGLLQSKARDHLLTTPDRLTADGGLLEIKTVGQWAKVAEEWKGGGIARHAEIQAQQQMAVTGRTHAWFVVFQDPRPQLRGPIERDETLIALILERADWFWREHVVPGVEPLVDLASITPEEIALRWPTAVAGKAVEAKYPSHVEAMLAERAELKAGSKPAASRIEEIDKALKVFVGDAEVLTVDDRPVLTYKTVERAGYTVKPTRYRKLHIPSGKDS